jgi:hypothetical protein
VLGAELGVVEQKSGLLCGLLLERHLGLLGLALGGDLDVGDLATVAKSVRIQIVSRIGSWQNSPEAEEVTDLAIGGRAGDVGNVDSRGRHIVGILWSREKVVWT